MTFTFDEDLTSARDEVRLKIGDTSSGAVLLSDETLDALLTAFGDNVVETSIAAVNAILAKIARDADKSALGITSNLSQKTAHYQQLLRQLQAESGGCAQVYFGGSSEAEIESLEADTDFVHPVFKRGQHRNPKAVSTARGVPRGSDDGS